MPPKKRKIAASPEKSVKAEAEPAKKNVKKENSDVDVDRLLDDKVQWQFEEKPGTWMLFDDETQKTLTSAYNNKEEECEIDDGEFIIMFTKPSRKTKKTGYQKRVRIALQDDSENQVITWSWEDGRKKRRYYSVKTVLDLENDANSTSIDAYSEGKPCNVNPKEKQHDGKFKMFREAADAKPAADKPAAKPAAAATSKSAASKAATALKKMDAKAKEPVEEVKEKTVVMKGKAPVDSECPKASSCHVFYEPDCVWDCMLNQTNLQNNNNKYYLIQLLKDDKLASYSVWMRWGRVGKKGQTAMFPCGPDLNDAKAQFCSKFRDKTKNDWSDRKHFVKVPGKYDLLEMDYDAGGDVVDAPSTTVKSEPVKTPDSKLDAKLQNLIKLICDVKAMEEAVVEMKYDAKKAPLGKLTKAQIKQGYQALKEIESLLEKGDFGFKLTEACNKFYTRIPHDFGMRPPEKITSTAILKNKMALLEALGDIEIAVNVLKSGDKTINPLDSQYASLECQLKPMDRSHHMYKVLEEYLLQTHATTHNQYSLELVDIFECDKNEDCSSSVGNKMLLWHGSRLTNWVGILAKGLRIAPPEAPVTGYMFGKGVYFADCSSKSANYCFPTKQKNEGLLLLSEVALGDINELLSSDYRADKLPSGKHSVKGCGKMAPDPSTYITEDGVVVPRGTLKDTGVTNPHGYTLNYNEFIVYNTNQIKMKYLLKVKFNFKY